MKTSLKDYLTVYKDFPKPGITFYDVMPLFKLKFSEVIRDLDAMLEDLLPYRNEPVVFAGIESRGFILAAGLADYAERGFIPVRKAGKLPGVTQSLTLNTEYSCVSLEVKPAHDSPNVILVDDVIATGGTILGAEKLLTKAGYNVVGKACVLNLTQLNAIPKHDIMSLIEI